MESAYSQRRVSDAEQLGAGRYELYADNEVKNEYVFQPELLEPQDIDISIESTLNESDEEEPCNLMMVFGARATPECTHARSGLGDHCNKCLEQQFGLSLKKKLVAHKQEPVDTETHTCKSCGMIFDSDLSLKNHCDSQVEATSLYTETINKILSKGRTFYICHICGDSFVQQGPLICHFATHASSKSKNCVKNSTKPTAPSSFPSLSREHKKVYSCKNCEKKYPSKHGLAAHSRIHYNTKHALSLYTDY